MCPWGALSQLNYTFIILIKGPCRTLDLLHAKQVIGHWAAVWPFIDWLAWPIPGRCLWLLKPSLNKTWKQMVLKGKTSAFLLFAHNIVLSREEEFCDEPGRKPVCVDSALENHRQHIKAWRCKKVGGAYTGSWDAHIACNVCNVEIVRGVRLLDLLFQRESCLFRRKALHLGDMVQFYICLFSPGLTGPL